MGLYLDFLIFNKMKPSHTDLTRDLHRNMNFVKQKF